VQEAPYLEQTNWRSTDRDCTAGNTRIFHDGEMTVKKTEKPREVNPLVPDVTKSLLHIRWEERLAQAEMK
jgi:hypothetical protein